MWCVEQGLLNGTPVFGKGATRKNRAKASRDVVWELWTRKAEAFLSDVPGRSSGSFSSKSESQFLANRSCAIDVFGPVVEGPAVKRSKHVGDDFDDDMDGSQAPH